MTYSTRCHSRSPLLANWLLVLASVAFHGCGGQRVEYVDGVVTLDGKPVSRAIVQFIPRGEGRHAGGQTDAGGMYLLNTMGGTSGGGGGAGVPRNFSSTHTPRATGEVVLPLDVTA